MIKKRVVFLATTLAFFAISASQCINQRYYHRNQATQVVQNERPTLTIWVHGTQMPFTKLRSISGLHDASAYNKKDTLFLVAQTLSKADPEQFPSKQIRMFGWEGHLDKKNRKESAKKLYKEVILLIESFEKEHGVKPKIRLITHSHGGNVALYLAQMKKNQKIKLEIDELVLLACPVQKLTAHLLADPMFKTVYHFYSPIDLTQVIDPLCYDWQGGPTRTFPEQKNLIQCSVGPIMHRSFFKKRFVQRLPKLLEQSKKTVK